MALNLEWLVLDASLGRLAVRKHRAVTHLLVTRLSAWCGALCYKGTLALFLEVFGLCYRGRLWVAPGGGQSSPRAVTSTALVLALVFVLVPVRVLLRLATCCFCCCSCDVHGYRYASSRYLSWLLLHLPQHRRSLSTRPL